MTRKREIVGLQYLRGFCAIAVVFDHASGMAAAPKYFNKTTLNNTLVGGRIGVDIFFVISGFIITIVALRGKGISPATSVRQFFLRRFVRIIPLMWIAILSYAALRGLGRGVFDWPPYLRAFVLFPSGSVEPDNIWTLRHEFLFYAIFAVSFLGNRALRWLLIAWFVAPIPYLAMNGMLTVTNPSQSFPALLFRDVNLEFGMGFLVGLAWLRWPRATTMRPPIHPVPLLGILTVILIAVVASLPYPWRSIPQTIVIAVASAGLLWLAGIIRCPDDRLSRLTEYLGNASYSIYLFHLQFISAALGLWARLARDTPVGVVVAGTIVFATAASVVVYYFVERPLVRWVQRRTSARWLPVAVR